MTLADILAEARLSFGCQGPFVTGPLALAYLAGRTYLEVVRRHAAKEER